MSIQAEEKDSRTATSQSRQDEIKIIRRWGGLASDAILDPSCHYYKELGIDGLIGYRLENKTAIVFGDPVCAPTDIRKLFSSFHQYCQDEGWRVVYISASEDFAHWAIAHGCRAKAHFGDEYYIDPHNDPRLKTGNHASLVRRKVKHALNEGTVVKEHTSDDEAVEVAIEQAGIHWLEARRGPQIHISNLRLFTNRLGKRWFYAEQGGRIVGAVVLNRLDRHEGWLLNHIVFTPEAPHGTPELLVTSALETVAKEGCYYVTFGNSPSVQLGEMTGFNIFSSFIARLIYKTANSFFHLEGHKTFWDKFHPESKRSFLLFGDSQFGIRELLALKNALNVSL